MLLTGSVLRGLIATIYLITLSTSATLTLIYYSEPVIFAFVITAVCLLVLSYPILCLFTVSRQYDLEIRGLCCGGFQWIPNSQFLAGNLKIKVLEEKPTKLDEAFIYAYM
ncbi:hypothetical protein CRE_07845 [Caenorhabditis remanei]|uniref:Uncharacterized protein n=1 Tax=Caenorhabditis remanei TaxID=31234 RepID=E3NGZ0_CAERE|nr:hypothetical protein CRE_07845 [Caenorhabditis remanei]